MRHTILSTTLFAALTLVGCAAATDAPDTADDTADGKADNGGDAAGCTTRVTEASQLQPALDAIGARGGDATLCIAAGTYTLAEPTLTGSGGELRIRGEGRNATTIHATLFIGAGWETVRLERFAVDEVSIIDSESRIQVSEVHVLGLLEALTTPDKGNTFLEIDRSMFGHQADASVRLFADGGPIDLSLTNSYLRGYVTIDSYSAPLDVDIVNNTFVGAFHVMAHNATGTIANNIFANASQASIVKYNLHPVVFSHNAYWNNAVNFRGGGVSSGVGDLFVDCQLATNSEGLPVIRAGSPCQGAGNSDLATEKDLLDRSRDARPDIGAIEAQ